MARRFLFPIPLEAPKTDSLPDRGCPSNAFARAEKHYGIILRILRTGVNELLAVGFAVLAPATLAASDDNPPSLIY